MKGNEGKILLGSLVIAILIVAAAYKFFYLDDVEKADAVQNEINTYQARLNELNEKSANRPLYEAKITESQDIIDTVLSLYGPGNSPEKSLMMIVDLCKKTGISVEDITFINDKIVYSSIDDLEAQVSGQEEVVYQTKATGEDTDGIRIFKSGVSMKLVSGYTQLKKLTDYVNSYPERMNAETFTAKFNPESGRLEVVMNVNMYSVVDKNHKYEAPVVEDIELSNGNIFKTLEYVTEEEATEEETNNIIGNSGNNTETPSGEDSSSEE